MVRKDLSDDELKRLGLDWRMSDLRELKEEITEEHDWLLKNIDSMIESLKAARGIIESMGERLTEVSKEIEESG